MARAKGFQGIVGRKKGATWGTATVPAALDGIEVVSLVPSGGAAMIEDNQITGRVTQREASAGLRNITVVLQTALRYEGNGREIAYVSIKDTKVEELPSVKWNKLKISGKAGERIEIEVSGICRDWTDASASNTTTTIDSITLPANRERDRVDHRRG